MSERNHRAEIPPDQKAKIVKLRVEQRLSMDILAQRFCTTRGSIQRILKEANAPHFYSRP